ncbi:MAG: hypothetical protein WCT31_05740, partial [Candidatus Micrarchaeia archaeon]
MGFVARRLEARILPKVPAAAEFVKKYFGLPEVIIPTVKVGGIPYAEWKGLYPPILRYSGSAWLFHRASELKYTIGGTANHFSQTDMIRIRPFFALLAPRRHDNVALAHELTHAQHIPLYNELATIIEDNNRRMAIRCAMEGLATDCQKGIAIQNNIEPMHGLEKITYGLFQKIRTVLFPKMRVFEWASKLFEYI